MTTEGCESNNEEDGVEGQSGCRKRGGGGRERGGRREGSVRECRLE